MDKKQIEEIKKYILNKEYITDEIYINYIINEIIKRDLTKYVRKVEFDDDKHCIFDIEEKLITINPNEILYENANNSMLGVEHIISKKEQKTGRLKDLNKVNLYIFFDINHEIEHANQINLLDTLDSDEHLDDLYTIWRYLLLIKDAFLRNDSIIYFNNMPYNNYHDYYICEYDANINSYINTLNFLNNLDIKEIETNIKKFNMLIAKYILYLYRDIENKRKFSTPSTNFIKLYNHIRELLHERNIYNSESFLNLYKGIEKPSKEIDRLKLGFKISKDTYKYLTLVSKEKHKTLNLFNDITNI